MEDCYRLNVSISHNIHFLKPNPQCDDIWRWGLWEMVRSGGWSAHNGISVLIKEIPEICLALSAIKGHMDKTAVYELGSRFSPDTKSASTLILDFPGSRSMRNKFLLFMSHPGYGLPLRKLEWTKTGIKAGHIFLTFLPLRCGAVSFPHEPDQGS